MRLVAIHILVLALLLPVSAIAQGSIFGEITNTDLSHPADSEIVFFGFLRDTDDEVRLSTSDGAGYENGNWFDDFQNYLDEGPGIPYDYHFFNLVNGRSAVLSKLVPNNSFQQENVQLGANPYPDAPADFKAQGTDIGVRLSWTASPGIGYHVYRRAAASNGSFFRIDDTSGDMSHQGVIDSAYVDTLLGDTTAHSYMIIADDGMDRLSPPSPIITVAPGSCCQGMTGDVDQDPLALRDIDDILFLIDYLFFGGPAPPCPEAANLDNDPLNLDVGDISAYIDFLFLSGPPLPPCH